MQQPLLTFSLIRHMLSALVGATLFLMALAPVSVRAGSTAAPACGGSIVLEADADTWLEQEQPAANYGGDTLLQVKTHGSIKHRTLVGFPLPPVPAGCVIESATLQLYAAASTEGRILEARPLDGAWTEASATWGNQPPTLGETALATSRVGDVQWNVTGQVQALLDANAPVGFQIRDALEGNATDPLPGSAQQFHSREQLEHRPLLLIGWMPAPDTAAPETTIASGPEAVTTSTAATFTFAASEPGVTFECSLDGAEFVACTSPVELLDLAPGLHVLEVRAVDAAGNADPTPAQYTWTVETSAGTTEPGSTDSGTTEPGTTEPSGDETTEPGDTAPSDTSTTDGTTGNTQDNTGDSTGDSTGDDTTSGGAQPDGSEPDGAAPGDAPSGDTTSGDTTPDAPETPETPEVTDGLTSPSPAPHGPLFLPLINR